MTRAEAPSIVCVGCGAYAFLGGLTSFLGWAFDLPRLTDWIASGISTQPNAAVCAAATGFALILLGLERRTLVSLLGVLVGLIGFATLWEHVSGAHLGIDSLLTFGREWGRRGILVPGRMGPPASVSWSVIGVAILLATSPRSGARRWVPFLSALVCGIASLSLIGYLFEADLLHAVPRLTVIAFQTTTFVFAAGVGLMASVPEHGLAALLRRDDTAGIMARRVLIPALVVPVLLGWLRLIGERIGLYDSAFGTAARTLSEIALLAGLLLWALREIARAEDARKRGLLALDVRDHLLGTVTEHAAVGLAIIGPKHRYLYANRQYAAILDLPTTLAGQRVEETLPTVYEAQVEPRLEQAFAGERVRFELTLPLQGRGGRTARLFDVIGEPQWKGAEVDNVVLAITDVTERKAVEWSARDQANLLELAHDAIMLLEMDGTIVSWNHGAVETYGFLREESLGKVAHQLLHTVFPQPLSEIYAAAEQQGRWEGELVHTTKEGRRIVVASRWAVQPAAHGRPARIMEINRDVTERKAAEDSLRAQSDLIELAHDAIMVLEMDGTIVSWNQGAAETYGYSREESLGKVAHQLLHTVFPQPLSEIYTTAEQQGRWEGDLVHTTKEGRRIVVASRWALEPGRDGRAPRIMEINRNVTQRKQMEAALHAKEAELGLVTGTTPVALTRCSRDLRFLFANDAAAALFDCTPEQMVGRQVEEIAGEEAFALMHPGIERVLRGEPVEIELELPHSTLGMRWMRANYIPERNAEGEVVGWIASITDITERKRVEEKVRESERTERLLAEIGALAAKIGVADGLQLDDVIQAICEHVAIEMGVSRAGFGRVDLEGGHVMVDAEAAGNMPALKGVYPLTDYAAHLLEDGIAGRITPVVDLAEDPRTSDRYERLYEPLGMRSSINVPLHRNGRWVAHFWISSAQPHAWTETEIDRMRRTAERIWLVIEQARVSANLRESEARLARELAAAQHLQEVSTQLIQDDALDLQLRRILAASAAIAGTDKGNIQLLGPDGRLHIAAHQGLGPRFVEFFADHGWEAGSDAAMHSEQRLIVEDLALLPGVQDSEELNILLEDDVHAFQCTPIAGRDGRFLGMLNNHFRTVHRPSESDLRYLDVLARMAADLIERKQVDEALREADRRKDEFLATLAHELRNPLAPIRNAVNFLRLQAQNNSSAQSAHEIIDRQLQHMVRLVDDLLEVSRITSGRIELQKQRVDLSSILAQAVETVRTLIDASGHQLTVSLPKEPIALDVDPVRMTQVIANLLNNASKYTPQGGRIDLTVRTERRQVVVSVKDSGVGIPPQMIDKVFGLFTQVDRTLERTSGGLGIGLHLVKRLVEMHGGTVSARSAGEGQGSEFILRLPAPVPVSRASEPPLEIEETPPTAPRRILLVDDNQDSLDSLSLLLQHQGHRTEVAHDGQEAVDKAQSWRPDVILLDIGLPIMNGYDACRAIRRLPFAKDIRIIALSGWGQEQDRAMAKEAGFDEHLVKPVNFATLMKLLDEPELSQA